jgi:hypothetical protein
MGRRGLIMADGGSPDQALKAIDLLTQAVNQGCQSEDVYASLLEILIEADRKDEALALRKRHGQRFGDLSIADEVPIAPWVTALSTGNYDFFKGLIAQAQDKSPDSPLRACQIFQAAAPQTLP